MPILYSYRRCPYAMRARMALKLAGITVETREISLRDKPAHMLEISPKGTVPVLLLDDGTVLEESLAIMYWALKEHALQASMHEASGALILKNDSQFKKALDAYKYPERYPNQTRIQHRQAGELFLQALESLLKQTPFLFGDEAGFADIAIFPFVRQFAAVDDVWWQNAAYSKLRAWLNAWLASDIFNSIMTKNPTYVG